MYYRTEFMIAIAYVGSVLGHKTCNGAVGVHTIRPNQPHKTFTL